MTEREPTARKGEYPIPANARPERCRSCGANVVWTKTANGKWTPLSLATVVRRDGQRYALVHWHDCPDAEEWSRK